MSSTTETRIPRPREPKREVTIVRGHSLWQPWMTSFGDDVQGQTRGLGQKLEISFTNPGNKNVEAAFMEPVELCAAEFQWLTASWALDDLLNLVLVMPPTVATPNGGNNGNANLVAAGSRNRIIPAPGNGTHDVNLAEAVPVPPGPQGNGGWIVDQLTGQVTPAPAPGQGDFHMYDQEVLNYVVRRLAMANPLGAQQILLDQALWISERWKLRFACNRVTTLTAKVNCTITLCREFVE